MKNFRLPLAIFLLFCTLNLLSQSPSDHATYTKKMYLDSAYALYKAEKYVKSIALLDEGMKHFKENRIWFLNSKYNILDQTDNYSALVDVAIERAEFFKDSPKKSREVVLAYLKSKNNEKAIEWLKITHNRGYQEYVDLLENEAYNSIRGGAEFQQILDSVAITNGIDKAAKAITGTTIEGSPITLKDLKGKVVLIDFWALYCGPCLVEMKNLLRYYPELHYDGFEILAVNLDEDKVKVLNYIDKQKIPWPVLYSGAGWDDEARVSYNLANIPSYWLVDRKGVLRYTGLSGKKLESTIRSLVTE